jgi:hypothetical protein
MATHRKKAPSEGEYVVTVYAIGYNSLIFDEDKDIKETDIIISVRKVTEGGEWPIKVETDDPEEVEKIEPEQWIANTTQINGIHTVRGVPEVSFPYSFVSDDPKVNQTYQSQIIIEKLQIGDGVYFVEDYELRRCQHPDLMKIQSEREKSGGLFNLVEGSVGKGESLICTKCNSVVM